VAELLPWYANGTLSVAERSLVDDHVHSCESCGRALALERRIFESVRVPRDNVEPSPHAAWQRLAARLDGLQPLQAAHHARAGSATIVTRPRWWTRFGSSALGLAVALQAATIAVLAVLLVRERYLQEQPRFHTLATPDRTLALAEPLARVAFDASVSSNLARELAADIAGRVVEGPSVNNVYTLAFDSARARPAALDEKVAWLRKQPHVLFAEPVMPDGPD
jgi:hypothetical protein